MAKPINLAGVDEKLKRANENIVHLTGEIDAILGPDRNRIIGEHEEQAIQEFIQTHLSRPVTPRLSVLAAECIHNLRSCLDQLAWQLVVATGATPDTTSFPLRLKAHRDEKAAASYNACVEGMSAAAKAYILALQPYQPGNGGRDHKLRILHDLNITDKHHELVIIKNAYRTQRNISFLPAGVGLHRVTIGPAKDGAVPIGFDRPVRAVKVNTEITIQIVFSDFGESRLVPVPDGLWTLHQTVTRVVTELAPLA